MYIYESWTIKKAERWRIDAFELGVGEVSWESRELQDQILKEINSEYRVIQDCAPTTNAR